MKKRYLFLIIIIVAAILVVAGFFLFAKKAPVNPSSTTLGNEVIPKQEATLIINNGESDLKNSKLEIKQGWTAFDLLKKGTEESGLALKTKEYDAGIFIQAIGDKENGQDGKYWLYYVNGEMPQVGADKKEVKAGDKVEFKFEKSSF